MKILKRINEGLPGLVLGILIWGALVEAVGVWFYPDHLRYSIGVLVGTACCIFCAIHLAVMINDSVAGGGDESVLKRVKVQSGARFAVVFVVLALMMYFNLGWWGSAFISLLGLKAGAYAQPIMHKAFHKTKEEEVKE